MVWRRVLMKKWWLSRVAISALTLGTFVIPALAEPVKVKVKDAREEAEGERDDAELRQREMKKIFGEWTPEYQKFVAGAAAKERARWRDRLPGNTEAIKNID